MKYQLYTQVTFITLGCFLLVACDSTASTIPVLPSSKPTGGIVPTYIIKPSMLPSTPSTPTTQPAPTSAPPTADRAGTTPPTASIAAQRPATNSEDQLYIAETGHYIKGSFLKFWQTYGKQAVFGNPLSEAFEQDGQQVQLFEQALLEFHPDKAGQKDEIQLGMLGHQLAEAQALTKSNPAFAPVSKVADTSSRRYFPQTSHILQNDFLTFWENNGLLKFLGYPISELFNLDGLRVQYFERGRLEYSTATREVTYSNSGDLLIAAKKWPAPEKYSLLSSIIGNEVQQGQTVMLDLSNDDQSRNNWQPVNLQGHFNGDTLRFTRLSADGNTYFKAFEPISVSLQPATYPLEVSFIDQGGRTRLFSLPLKVKEYDYGTQDLSLIGDLSSLADHAADDFDNTQLARAYQTFTPQLLWQGKWQWPVTVPWTMTTNFGQRRVFNGKVDTLYYHGGIDLAPNSGQNGDPVYASASGKVIYIGSLQARGLSVVLDHGLGVTSYYFHLGQIEVQVGQSLRVGQILGQVGSTGRATGPHLDWEVRVNGIITDPRNFLNNDFSKFR